MKSFPKFLQNLRPEVSPADAQLHHHEPKPPVMDSKELNLERQERRRSHSEDIDSDHGLVHQEMQPGIQKVEATAQAWGKWSLIAIYMMIWVLYFLDSMENGMTSLLTPYVTSSFQAHSLTAATSIMANLIGGIFKLPLAKIIDVWGRPQGFLLMVVCMTIGMIMMASCQNVQTYAAAEVFNWLGGNGRAYVMSILIADTTSLKYRGFMFAFIASPYIITVWITGPLAQAFLNGPGFRWAFAAFAIVTPLSSLPLYILMQYNYRKAVEKGLMPVRKSGRTLLQSIKHYAIEYDLVGLFLICSGLALFLLPFSLYSYQVSQWESPLIICMLIFGVVILVAFGFWEAYGAPVTFMPWHLLKDRTVLGANILAAVCFIEFYIWNSYYSSFLQVVPNLSLMQTGYIVNIYSIGACFWSFACGIVVAKTGDFKKQALLFGLPLTALGVGLMTVFRQPDVNIGNIVMCQIFIAFGGGTLVITQQIAAMAATTHQYVAVVLAVEGMFSSIGGAIGSSVAAAIWTGTFLDNLYKHLPLEAQANASSIYADLETQLSFDEGSPIRAGINEAYGESIEIMCISATAILALAVAAVLMWRDIDVRKHKQVKGLMF